MLLIEGGGVGGLWKGPFCRGMGGPAPLEMRIDAGLREVQPNMTYRPATQQMRFPGG